MSDEKLERVRRSVQLILDAVSVDDAELAAMTDGQLVLGLGQPLLDVGGVIIDLDADTIDLSGVLMAVQWLVSAVVQRHADHTNQDRLELISSLRELADRELAPMEGD